MPAKLGSLLVHKGIISPEQLEEGLQSQIMFGGRLGTNLVELEFLTEDTLARVLGEQYGIPFCAGEELKKLTPTLVKLVPADLVAKHRAVPVKAENKNLWMAMIDPGNLASLDEISFATGHKVHPMIAPESSVLEVLEQQYGVARDQRYVVFSDKKKDGPARLTRSTMEFFETSDARIPRPPAETLARPKAVPAAPEVPPPAPFPTFTQLDPLEADSLFPLSDIAEVLTEARSKEDIFQAILSPFMEFFERYALFVNKNEVMVGQDARGGDFSREMIEQVAIPLKVPSIFREVSQRKDPFFGPLPEGHNNQKITTLLKLKDRTEPCLICPIQLVARVGVMVYADRCKDVPAAGSRLKKFENLSSKAGLAFQVLVLKQKILHL